MFEVFTTFRPCRESDIALVEANPILLAIPPGVSLNILNRECDLPEKSAYSSLLVEGFDRDRPEIGDYFDCSENEVIAVANSDIILPSNLADVMKGFSEHKSTIAAARRFDVPAEVILGERWSDTNVRKHFKQQSRRTLDCFLIKKSLFIDARELVPGTAGFDNALLAIAYGLGHAVLDFSPIATFYHSHHEPFRIPFKLNLICSLEEQGEFSSGRKSIFNPSWYGGCLSQSDFEYRSNGSVQESSKLPKFVRLKAESARIKSVNTLEKLLFGLNRGMWRFCQFLYRVVTKRTTVKLVPVFGALILRPSFSGARKDSDAMSISANLLETDFATAIRVLGDDHIDRLFPMLDPRSFATTIREKSHVS